MEREGERRVALKRKEKGKIPLLATASKGNIRTGANRNARYAQKKELTNTRMGELTKGDRDALTYARRVARLCDTLRRASLAGGL